MIIVDDERGYIAPLRRLLPEYELLHLETAEELLPALRVVQGVVGVVSDSPAIHLAPEVKREFNLPFVVYTGKNPASLEIPPEADERLQKPDSSLPAIIRKRCKG